MKRYQAYTSSLRRDTLRLCLIVTSVAALIFFKVDPRLPDWHGGTWAPLGIHTVLVFVAALALREWLCILWT